MARRKRRRARRPRPPQLSRSTDVSCEVGLWPAAPPDAQAASVTSDQHGDRPSRRVGPTGLVGTLIAARSTAYGTSVAGLASARRRVGHVRLINQFGQLWPSCSRPTAGAPRRARPRNLVLPVLPASRPGTLARSKRLELQQATRSRTYRRRKQCPNVAGSAPAEATNRSGNAVVGTARCRSPSRLHRIPQQRHLGAFTWGLHSRNVFDGVSHVSTAGTGVIRDLLRGTAPGRYRSCRGRRPVPIDSWRTPPAERMPLPIANMATSIAGVSAWLFEWTMLPTMVVFALGVARLVTTAGWAQSQRGCYGTSS